MLRCIYVLLPDLAIMKSAARHFISGENHMIISRKKPFEEVLELLGDAKKVILVGCGSCATSCKVGGESELDEMEAFLNEHGIEVAGRTIPEETCQKMLTKKHLKAFKDSGAQAIIGMECGNGVQTIAQLTDLPVYPSANTLFLGQIERIGIFNEECRMCGDCVLGLTGGICPVTQCAKSLINGPCGGQKDGRCEVNPENPCAWIEIYKKLESMNQLEKLAMTRRDKGYAAHTYPRHVNVKEKKENKEA